MDSVKRECFELLERKAEPAEILEHIKVDEIDKRKMVQNMYLLEVVVSRAISRAYWDLITYLLQLPAYCSSLTTHTVETICNSALQDGNIEWIDSLLNDCLENNSGPKIEAMVKVTIQSDRCEILTKLIEHPQHQLAELSNKQIHKRVDNAITSGSAKCLDYLLSHHRYNYDIKTTSYEPSPLFTAARHSPHFLPKLLQHGADGAARGEQLANLYGKNALLILSGKEQQPKEGVNLNFVDLAKILIEAGIDVHATSYNNSILYRICEQIQDSLRDKTVIHRKKGMQSTTTDANPSRKYDFQTSDQDRLDDTTQASQECHLPVPVDKGLGLKIYGSDIRDCVNYVCSWCHDDDLVFGIQGALKQINILNTNSWDVRCVRPALRCVYDLVKIITSHHHSNYKCQSFDGIYACDRLLEILLTCHRKGGYPYEETFPYILDVIQQEVFAILKEIVRFDCYRKISNYVIAVDLILQDARMYLPVFDILLYHQCQTESSALLTNLQVELVRRELKGFPNDNYAKNHDICLQFIRDNLMISLKHLARKTIVQNLGGNVQKSAIDRLPLPASLQKLILG